MNVVHAVLARVFVIPFYQANATFILFIAVMAGGFMSKVEHVALASFFVSTPLSLLVPITLWALYTIKVLRFNQALLLRAENTFMQHYCLLPIGSQWLGWLSAVAAQLLPVIAYGIFLGSMAIQQKAWMSLVVVVLALVVLILFTVALLYRARLYFQRQHTPGGLRRWLDKTFVRPYPLFFIEWIVRRQPLLLFGTKAFGCLLLFGITYLYTDETYDSRLLIMGITAVAAANLQLVWELLQFEHVHFSIVRQLPLPFGRRILYTSVTLCALLLPEVGLIITYLPANLAVTEAMAGVVYLLAGAILFYGILHWRDRAPEQLGGIAFAWVIGSVVLTLFHVPALVLAAVNLFLGLYGWMKYFYRFEQRAGN